MPFLIDSAAEIRDRALAAWRAKYLARGEDLSIEVGSDAFNELDALSMEFEGLGLGAQEAAHRVLLRYQRGQDLDDSAEDDGTRRKPASKTRRTVTIVGPATTTSLINGATLAHAGGLRFTPIDSTGATLTATPTTDGSGNATMTVECTTPGSAANQLANGSVLTWSSAPAGFGALATLGSVTVAGEDAESDDALRERLLLRRRERPGGGNRSWWNATLKAVAGVGEVFIYRVMTASEVSSGVYDYRPNRQGNISAIVVAPAPTSYAEGGDGMVAGFSRAPSSALVTLVRDYLRGRVSVSGSADGTEMELYPAHMTEDHFFVVPPTLYERDVVVSVRAGAGWRWPTNSNAVFGSSSTTTVLALNLPLGDWQDGDRIAIAQWGAAGSATRIRGGWFLRRIIARDPVARTVTLDAPLPGVPPATTDVRPDAVGPGSASLWDALRGAIAQVFDAMGPGPGPSQTFRFPVEGRDGFPSSLSRASLMRAVLNTTGVEDATIDTPGASETSIVGGLFTLRTFTLNRLP